MHVGQVVKQERSVRGYCLEWLWLLYCLATSIVHSLLDWYTLTMNQYWFITLALFYRILICPNSLKADRHAFQWPHCVINSGGLTIGLLQQMITWYMVVGKPIIIPALGHQNKGKTSFTGSGLFVLMSQCGDNNELALQHGGFCTTWSLVAKGLLGSLK